MSFHPSRTHSSSVNVRVVLNTSISQSSSHAPYPANIHIIGKYQYVLLLTECIRCCHGHFYLSAMIGHALSWIHDCSTRKYNSLNLKYNMDVAKCSSVVFTSGATCYFESSLLRENVDKR